MKNLIKTSLLLLALLLPATAVAYDFEVGGIYYNINGNEVTVTQKGNGSWYDTSAYTGIINIPETVTYDGVTYAVTAIDASAFFGCSGLISVTVPNSVTKIGSNAFNSCSGLKTVTIGNGVSSIGNDAFAYCSGLMDMIVDSHNPKYDSRDGCNAIIMTARNSLLYGCQNTIIPNTVTKIENYAFNGCSTLKSVIIPSSVTSIGYGAFDGCSGVTSMIVDSDNSKYDSRDNCNAIIQTSTNTLVAGCQNTIIPNTVTKIRDYAFEGCTSLTSMTIPNSVTSIGHSAFYGCSGLADLTISNSLTRIQWGAFYGCSSLKSVTIPNSVTFIEDCAFMHCRALSSVEMSNSVRTIGESAFRYCNLLSVDIPQTVTKINDHAFGGCTNLKDVYSYITDLSKVSVGASVWPGFDSNRTLHVPYRTAAAYQADEHWYPYFGQIVEMDSEFGLVGDVNGDGQVDIADINAVNDIILGIDGYTTAADVNSDGEITIADLNAIIDIITGGDQEPVHEWVDLGLPSGTLWATCNVGANAPEEYGDYFSWGETASKNLYDWSTYKWCDGSDNTLTKYCTDNRYGTIDNKSELDPDDDAAFMNWGPSWRMPTEEQYLELEDKCSWTWTTMNGVSGYLVKGRNGNSIFLPGAGYRKANSQYATGSNGYYWSLALYSADDPSFARGMSFTQSGHRGAFGAQRSNGCVVRPVRMSQDDVYIEQKSLDLGGVLIGETCSGELTIVNCTYEDKTIKASTDAPFSFQQEDGSTSSMTVVAPAMSSVQVTVLFTSSTPGTYDGNVTVQCSGFDEDQKVIPVHALAFTDDFLQQDYVDLGLPSGTLWATRDIGANSPVEYGDRFAWGETAPKNTYTLYNYKWCRGSYTSLTKYCTDSDYGTVDNLAVLEPEDDAATVNWGPEWCMPSLQQIQELINSCTVTKAQLNGVLGHLVIGPNGTTMFMPANNHYWSRTLSSSPDYAYGLVINSNDWSWNYFWGPRAEGNRVRAVRKSLDNLNVYIEQESLDLGDVPIGETRSGKLTIVNNTSGSVRLTATVDEPFLFIQGEGTTSQKIITVSGNSSNTVTVMFTATTPGQFDGNVVFRSGALDGGLCAVPVHAHAFTDSIPQHEYVDLGLPSGTLWATCNVGASRPEQYGDYFAWGETEPKEYYDWNTYKWGYYDEDSYLRLTKYNTNIYYGPNDNKLELDPEDDAAYVNWGPEWRMPTLEEIQELDENCTWQWTQRNGVNGRLVTGPNGNSIFLPAAGGRTRDIVFNSGGFAYYWSRSLYTRKKLVLESADSAEAYIQFFSSGRHEVWYDLRYEGLPVRAVYVPQN